MDYLLILMLSLLIQSDAQHNNSEARRTINDSFDVNIGAGYGVGPDQPSNSLPKSTTKIVRTRDYPSNDLSRNILRNIREPRILTNFTPIKIPNTNSLIKSQNRIYDFTNFDNPPTSDFEDNSLNSYKVHESLPEDDKHLNVRQPIHLQKVINGLDKTRSKIVEVIKVPAVYEIHVQSDSAKDDHKSSISGFIHNGESHWKTNGNGKYKPIFNDFSTKFSDDYIKWLKNYYKKKEEEYLNENEKFNDEHIPNPVDFHENFEDPQPDWNNEHLRDEVLEPVLSHHYKNIGSFENKHDKDRYHNIDPTNKLRYTPWKDEDRTYDKTKNYAINNLKIDAGLGSFKSNPPPFKRASDNRFSQSKKSSEIYKINNKLDTFSNPTEFKRNQEITEFSQPQALHEVPAPYLGKYPRPKAFEDDTLAKSNGFIPQHRDDSFKVHSSISTTASFYNQENKSLGSSYNQLVERRPSKLLGTLKSEVVPSTENFVSSIKGNQHFIYGKRTEHVLSPKEIDSVGSSSTQRSSIYPDDYHRSYGTFHPSVLQTTNSEMLNKNNIKITDFEKDSENIPVTTAAPITNMNINNENDTSTFNKKSDDIYNDYNKKDTIVDDMDSWDTSMPMKHVYKSNYFTIYPKKVSDEKKNLLHNVHTADYGRNIKFYSKNTNPLKDNMFSHSTKNQNKSKQIEPAGYVIYITKKSTEKK